MADPVFSEPRLPPELEVLIFETAALSHPAAIPKLMLIAHRVKHWVEPLLYTVVFLPLDRRKRSDGGCAGFPTFQSTFFSLQSKTNPRRSLNQLSGIYLLTQPPTSSPNQPSTPFSRLALMSPISSRDPNLPRISPCWVVSRAFAASRSTSPSNFQAPASST
ncbi:hypothetical protein B0H19DRAFT_1172653 [Mycena capillaripes]|nr:hypothetical protein B0H19DRAFT_1172653 [Mycena capillaripes]